MKSKKTRRNDKISATSDEIKSEERENQECVKFFSKKNEMKRKMNEILQKTRKQLTH